MRFVCGVYRINAGYFQNAFRWTGEVLPFHEVWGEGGTRNGELVLRGFTEVLQQPGLNYTITSEAGTVTVHWTCEVNHGDVRDLEGWVEFRAPST